MRLRPGDTIMNGGSHSVVPHAMDMAPTPLELERERAPRCGMLIEDPSGDSAPCALWRGHDGAHNGFTSAGRSLTAGASREERLARLQASQGRVLHELREVVAVIDRYGPAEQLVVRQKRWVREARRLACSWEEVGAALGVSADEAFEAWKDVVG